MPLPFGGIARNIYKSILPERSPKQAPVQEAVESVAFGPKLECVGFVFDHEPEPGTEDDIRTRAYYLWEAAGRPEGDGAEFWIAAESQLS